MANIQERRDKSGKLISYSIRVHRGRDADGKQIKPWTTTFDVQPTWTEKSARKKAEAFAATFEKECREGTITDNRQTFEKYAEYVLSMKQIRGAKQSTMSFYRDKAVYVYSSIGHLKLKDIRPEHLNKLYGELLKDGVNKRGGKLSVKTVLGYHRFISMVLETAVKEGIIPYAASARVDLPKAEKKTPNYFQPEELADIQNALKSEPFKWQVIVHLLMITGCRRGEILGLKWESVDFDKSQLHICNNILYRPGVGVYCDTPKTDKSDRYISVPAQTVKLLKEYKKWQFQERLRLGEYFNYQGYVFSSDNGNPLHPDSVTTWLDRFSKRHDLPHINPHAFRHTAASLLYFGGLDSVTISARLGHAQVSTTADIYAHVMEEADRRSADVLADMMLKNA